MSDNKTPHADRVWKEVCDRLIRYGGFSMAGSIAVRREENPGDTVVVRATGITCPGHTRPGDIWIGRTFGGDHPVSREIGSHRFLCAVDMEREILDLANDVLPSLVPTETAVK